MEDRSIEVVTLGELLIDFTETGYSEQGHPLYEANPGGAVANVMGMLAKLGRRTAFIGKVGKDAFGRQLRAAVVNAGIDDTGLLEDEHIHTTLAFVSRTDDGDRDFSFYRNPGADIMLAKEELPRELIAGASVFHFGSLSLTDEPVRSAHVEAMKIAEEKGLLRSFDPNLRESLWSSLDLAKEQIAWGMAHCDLLKISDNEIQWFTGLDDYDEGVRKLQEEYHIPLICLSMGADGSRAYYRDLRVEVPAFRQDETVDTTGAGDTFGACVLDGVMRIGLEHLNGDDLRELLTFANAAASLITMRKGAMSVMPSREEVLAFLQERNSK